MKDDDYRFADQRAIFEAQLRRFKDVLEMRIAILDTELHRLQQVVAEMKAALDAHLNRK